MKRVIRLFIRGYQWLLAPLLRVLLGGGSCRFQPTCSNYFLGAVESHGALRGSALGWKRLCRCHPWGGQGDDPVPPVSAETSSATGALSGLTSR